MGDDGFWNSNLLQQMFSQEIIELITSILPPSNKVGLDRRLWPGNRQGEFIVASAYQRLIGNNFPALSEAWKSIW